MLNPPLRLLWGNPPQRWGISRQNPLRVGGMLEARDDAERPVRVADEATIERGVPMGQGRVELPTSRLSGVRSNHLSYWPVRDVKDKWSADHGQPATAVLAGPSGKEKEPHVHITSHPDCRSGNHE